MANVHQFDVVVVGAGGAGLHGGSLCFARREDGGDQQVISHTFPYWRGARRNQRGVRQHRRRSSRMAHV